MNTEQVVSLQKRLESIETELVRLEERLRQTKELQEKAVSRILSLGFDPASPETIEAEFRACAQEIDRMERELRKIGDSLRQWNDQI
jgi:predicted  nucleic acid-binding Zn-ribbon protein